MNAQKNADFSNLFADIEQMLVQKLSPLELNFELGKLLDRQSEASAVAAVAKHLADQHPEMNGFSPRSLRRMRAFYRAYKDQPSTLRKALRIGWTQNIVIFEADLTASEREWYILMAGKSGWSKLELTRKIAEKAHLHSEAQEVVVSDTVAHNIVESTAHSNIADDIYLRLAADIIDFRLRSPLQISGSTQVRRSDLEQTAHLQYPEIRKRNIHPSVGRPIKDISDIEQIANLCWQKNEPVFLTKNGYTNLVVMSLKAYKQQMELLDMYSKLLAVEKQPSGGGG